MSTQSPTAAPVIVARDLLAMAAEHGGTVTSVVNALHATGYRYDREDDRAGLDHYRATLAEVNRAGDAAEVGPDPQHYDQYDDSDPTAIVRHVLAHL